MGLLVHFQSCTTSSTNFRIFTLSLKENPAISIHSSLSPLPNVELNYISIDLLILNFSYKQITYNIRFCDWLLPLGRVFSRFMHAVFISKSFYLLPNNISLYGCATSCISTTNGYSSCFHFLVMMNSVSVNKAVQIFVWTHFVFWSTYRSYGSFILEYLRNYQLLSRGCTIL